MISLSLLMFFIVVLLCLTLSVRVSRCIGRSPEMRESGKEVQKPSASLLSRLYPLSCMYLFLVVFPVSILAQSLQIHDAITTVTLLSGFLVSFLSLQRASRPETTVLEVST